MTAAVSAVVSVGSSASVIPERPDSGIQPRVHRRRPFDLHWRKRPPASQGSVELTYQRLYPHLTADDLCCVQCGSRQCPFDHEEEQRRKFQDVEFIGTLVAEKNSLMDQLAEMRAALNATAKEKEEWTVEKESLQRQLAEKERNCRKLETERSSLVKNLSRVQSRQILSSDSQRQRTDIESPSVNIYRVEEDDDDHFTDRLTGRRGSSKDRREVARVDVTVPDVEIESSSSSNEDQLELSSPRARTQRLVAQRGQLKRRLADIRERSAQLELQLAKTQKLLDAARKRLADHPCFTDGGDEGQMSPQAARRRALAGFRGGNGAVASKRDLQERLQETGKRLDETEKAKSELDSRLSATLAELNGARISNERMIEELAARDNELADLKRQMQFDRGFRRHVELLRELNEARELNNMLQDQLKTILAKDTRVVATISADGKLRRKTTTSSRRSVAVSPSKLSSAVGEHNQPDTDLTSNS